MKQINITKRVGKKPVPEYSLGNGKRLQFSSKRTANKFLADTNRYLTKSLVLLNLTYISLFEQYRLLWLVGTNTNSGKRTNYTDLEQKIKSHLSTADFMFDKFNSSTWGSSDPYFSFIDLRKAALYLQEAGKIMVEFHKKRNNTAAFYSCQALTDRCASIITRLDEYDYVK